MWSKRPKLGAKGLRCKILILDAGKRAYFCERPARRYACSKKGLDGSVYDLGTIDCCVNHARKVERQGVTLMLMDRRRKT
jgi:hypothetical protein